MAVRPVKHRKMQRKEQEEMEMGAHELGVFDDIAEAIDAAYEAQRTLMLEYTTMDRDRLIAKI